MGDRANVVIVDDTTDLSSKSAIFFYTHWSGEELPATLKAGLDKGESRWDDPSYLARVIFQAIISDDDEVTGYGISTMLCDNDSYPLLVVDVRRQVVVEYPLAEYRAVGFAKLDAKKGAPFAEYKGKWGKRS